MTTRSSFDPNQKRASDGRWEKQSGTRPLSGTLSAHVPTHGQDTAYGKFSAVRDDLHDRYARGEITQDERDYRWESVIARAPLAMTELALDEHPDAERIELELTITDEGSFLTPIEILTTTGEIITLDEDDDTPLQDVLFSVTGEGLDGTEIYGIHPRKHGTDTPDAYTYWVASGRQQDVVSDLVARRADYVLDDAFYQRHVRPLSEQPSARADAAAATTDPQLLDFLAHDHIPAVSRAAINNPRTSPATLHSIITTAATRRPDPNTVIAAIHHPAIAPETLRHAFEHRHDNEWAAAAASHVTASANCPPDVLARAWEGGDDRAAAHPSFPAEHLAAALEAPTPAVASNPRLTDAQLTMIAKQAASRSSEDDTRAELLHTVARHLHAPRELLSQLATDDDAWVARTAKERIRALDHDWTTDLLGGA